MLRQWKSERGSALVFVMYAVVISGLLFGALWVLVQSESRQAVAHQDRVRAEYEAQKLMEIALYEFYNAPDQFELHFTTDDLEDDEVCYSFDTPELNGEVCYTETDESRSLKATAFYGHGRPTGVQTATITVNLDDPEAGGDTGGGTGGDPGGDPGGDTGRDTVFGGAGDTREPYPGDDLCSPSPQTLLVRALVLGAEFNTSAAMRDEDRITYTDYPYSVEVIGGLYIDNGQVLTVPNLKNNNKFDVSINLNGYLTPEGGLAWGHGNGHQDQLTYNSLGIDPIENACLQAADFSYYLDLLNAEAADPLKEQQVPVYQFSGDLLTMNSLGRKKAAGLSTFVPHGETLGQVIQKEEAQIVLIEGDLLLDPGSEKQLKTSGYLIIHQPNASSTLYLPDELAWEHNGSITGDRVGSYSYKNRDTLDLDAAHWPQDYRLYLTLSRADADRYRQTTD